MPLTRSSRAATAFRVGILVACAACWFGDAGLAQGSGVPGVRDEPFELPTDLDRRIADLEQSAARTGAGNVSVQLYGQVNRAVIAWDDGFVTDAMSVDNSTSSTRVGMFGQGRIGERWALGYRLEMEVRDDASETLAPSGYGPGGEPLEDGLRIRHAYWYASDQSLGRLSVGQQSPATDDITILNLGSDMNDAAVHYNNAVKIRLDIAGGLPSGLTWGEIANSVDSPRGSFVRYDTPALYGFLLSAAWGEDDIWDVALRYQGDGQSFRFVAGIGYYDDREQNFRDVKGSASVIHVPTGLYLSTAGGIRDAEASVSSESGLAHFHYLQAGISRRWISEGKTTVYADYGFYHNFNVGSCCRSTRLPGSPWSGARSLKPKSCAGASASSKG